MDNIMKEEELRKWLLSLDPAVDSEEIVAWIMEALKMLHLTIDVDGIMRDLTNPGLVNILYIVAYGTPNLPYDFRQKKRVFFLSDLEDFYLRNDEEWKKCWNANFYDFDERKYLIPIE